MTPKYWSRGEIFSVKSSSRWSINHSPEIRSCFDMRGTLVGNKIFWQVNNDPKNAAESETILSFDLSSETFEYMSFPKNIKGLIRCLVVVRGCLGFMEMYIFQTRPKIVVWTLGNDISWSKFTFKECFEFNDGFIGSQTNDVFALLGMHKNKDEWKVKYLGHEAMKIFTYNLEDGKFIKVETNFSSCSFTLYDYVETLFLLK